MSDNEYTKQRKTMQYTETIYFKDGEEIAREQLNDEHTYDSEPPEAMTDEEIEELTMSDNDKLLAEAHAYVSPKFMPETSSLIARLVAALRESEARERKAYNRGYVDASLDWQRAVDGRGLL